MSQHLNPPHVRPLSYTLLAAISLGLLGCASQGPLRPPSLHLPAKVEHLSAERTGNTVDVRWTTPTKTTDGVPLVTRRHGAGPLTAEICRAEAPLLAGACTPVARLPVESGKPALFHDELSPNLSMGAAHRLAYRVRVVNGTGHGAASVDTAAVAGASIAPILELRAAPLPAGGVGVRWKTTAGPGDRVELRVVRGDAARSVTLAVDAAASDSGGADDAGARTGVVQQYTVIRTRTVMLNGQMLVMSSAPATVTVAASALPPAPEAPTGLEALANTLGTPEIDLVWQSAGDSGAVGYNVFRSTNGGAATALTSQPVRVFSFADSTVQPGVRYRYYVTAVDAHGTSSPPSAVTEQTVRVP